MKPLSPRGRQQRRHLAAAIGFFQIDRRGVGHRVPLIGARHIAAGRPFGRQADLVQIIDDDLRDGHLAGAEHRRGRTNLSLRPSSPTSNPSLTTTRQRPRFLQLIVHLVGQLLERAGAFGQIDLQRHLAARDRPAGPRPE